MIGEVVDWVHAQEFGSDTDTEDTEDTEDYDEKCKQGE